MSKINNCEYCTGSVNCHKDIVNNNIQIYINGKGMIVSEIRNENLTTMARINYCPMCGEPLRKER